MTEKEIRVEISLRNNRLYKAIFDNWGSVNAFCEEKGFQPSAVGELLNLKAPIFHKKTGEYREYCKKLADSLGLLVEDLFPPKLYKIEKAKVIKELSIAEVEIGWEETRKIPYHSDPQTELNKKQLAEVVEKILNSDSFSPRQTTMIKMYFGLNGYNEHTFEEIGYKYAVTPQAVGRVVSKMLRMLRHPVRSDILKDYWYL